MYTLLLYIFYDVYLKILRLKFYFENYAKGKKRIKKQREYLITINFDQIFNYLFEFQVRGLEED